MKKLIVIRHAPYGKDGHVSDFGREVIEMLIEKLRPLTDGQNVFILTSTTDRAKDTASILAESLGQISSEAHAVLWSEAGRPMKLPEALQLIQKHEERADVLIIVTHLEYAEVLSKYYAREVLKKEIPAQDNIQKGEAVVLDCESGEWTYVFKLL